GKMIGQTISHYKVLEKLGEGGMGVVYKAEDTKLKRTVALKFLSPQALGTEDEQARFIHEAQAAAALNHPNICTVHEIDEAEGQPFIAMEYIEGRSLKSLIESGLLKLEEAQNIAMQIVGGLHEAHRRQVVHRDIKPANIMITDEGRVKIMDFGLAKSPSKTQLTREGTTVGTVAYMSPEQARGEEVDHRTDIWSLGVVLYEMNSGQPPFKGDHEQAVMYSILNFDPTSPKKIRADIPEPLESIILRTLKKDPKERFQTVDELRRALDDFMVSAGMVRRTETTVKPIARALKKPAFFVPAALLVLILLAFLIQTVRQTSRARWARREALPRLMELVESEKEYAAFQLAKQVRDVLPDDPLLDRLWSDITVTTSVLTVPPAADVSMKAYGDVDGEWEHLGRSPLRDIDLPDAFCRLKIQKEGFEPIEVGAWTDKDSLEFVLDATGTIPGEMVRVHGNISIAPLAGIGWFRPLPLADFLIDRYEVTNRQFQVFVDSGGYERPDLWRHTFVQDGDTLSWEEAMAFFQDATGRAGPATWELSAYPEGRADFPVTGVSWYEAAAYAEFAGKSLPTIHHWVHAASIGASAHIIPLSNFDKKGLAAVGSHKGLGYMGTYDMAGNAREWCFNAEEGERYLLGGCWHEPHYMFNFNNARSPFDRSEGNGFRCIRQLGEDTLLTEARQDLHWDSARDYTKEKPVPDEVFEAYLELYRYDQTPLNAQVEFVDDEPPHWRIEKISFDAAYGNERMFAYLFLPRGTQPPYQVAVLFPGAYAMQMRSSDNGRRINSFEFVDFVIRSGRAVLCPVFQSTYERGDGFDIYSTTTTSSDRRAHMLMWWKDLSRSIDYLQTRDDIAHDKLAYFGSSWGGWLAPQYLAQDKRFQVAVLRLAGLTTRQVAPPFDPFNFAPRVKIPVLLLNGKYDYLFPYETSQKPLFEALGTPMEDKRLVVYETAHSVHGFRNEMIKETLDWLDRYLGPVE
ncbi:MAG: protein kinase, partial [Candidatus Latescibacterota bacterium]